MRHSSFAIALAGFAVAAALAPRAQAETQEIRLAKQFSMGYVQFNVLDDAKLIEKHAKARGARRRQGDAGRPSTAPM